MIVAQTLIPQILQPKIQAPLSTLTVTLTQIPAIKQLQQHVLHSSVRFVSITIMATAEMETGVSMSTYANTTWRAHAAMALDVVSNTVLLQMHHLNQMNIQTVKAIVSGREGIAVLCLQMMKKTMTVPTDGS